MNKQPENKQVNDLVAALGGFAEMTHVFYKAMVDAGADNTEAQNATNTFIFAFWHEQMEDARRKNGGQQGNE